MIYNLYLNYCLIAIYIYYQIYFFLFLIIIKIFIIETNIVIQLMPMLSDKTGPEDIYSLSL